MKTQELTERISQASIFADPSQLTSMRRTSSKGKPEVGIQRQNPWRDAREDARVDWPFVVVLMFSCCCFVYVFFFLRLFLLIPFRWRPGIL